jgi:hypothetical protein
LEVRRKNYPEHTISIPISQTWGVLKTPDGLKVFNYQNRVVRGKKAIDATKDDLKQIAQELGVTVEGGVRKQRLIELIEKNLQKRPCGAFGRNM